MENFQNAGEQTTQKGCLNCGSPVIEPGYPNPLCADCRQKFIKFPVPLSIKLFAAAIGAILIFSITKVSKNVSAGIHLQRGKTAEKKNNYLTAEQEYKKAIQLIPGLLEAKCHLLISAFQNQDFETLINTSRELEGKEIKDNGLYLEMTRAIENTSEYFPSDSFNVVVEKYHTADSIPRAEYLHYIRANPAEIFPILSYSNLLFDQNRYQECDSLLNISLASNKDNVGTLSLKTTVKRQIGEFDSSIYYCDRLLLLNNESAFGMSSKARTFFKQKKDKAGFDLASKSILLDPKDPYSIATMVLACHFNNKPADRDKLIEEYRNDSVVLVYMKYVNDVISGKEKFRD